VRHARPLALALIDIDHFKRVNDRYSHAIGDLALQELARLLGASVRHTDLVARLGGEEFVLVLVETDAESARRTCEKLRLAVAAHDWKPVHDGLALTVSIGYTADTTVDSPERMLALADRNLYVAKANGRNCVIGSGAELPARRAAGAAPR
jgi:diguanylate cyclase (GGDEF)-like protein